MTASCRFCAQPLTELFADLGATPVSNEFLPAARADAAEAFYPLRAMVCGACRLVQLQDFRKADDLFHADYRYFSSISQSWLAHCARFADAMAARFGLGPDATVVEAASNDGYLLQYFKQRGVRVLGVEPSASVAQVAIEQRGVPTEIAFFGRETAARLAAAGWRADLTAAKNVLAHVPDIADFVAGFATLLKPHGVATFEFPHLLRLMRENQFDTVYHEHFSYLSLLAVERIFGEAGLRVFDVEELPTHGGSLRLFACLPDAPHAAGPGLDAARDAERRAGLDGPAAYSAFAEQVRETKRALLTLLIDLKRQGKRIVGYGAPAKGNTLLNYCGIGADFLDFTVDLSPHKQGLRLPGTRLEIRHPDAIAAARPDYVLILPWNIREEVMAQMAHVADWGGRFITPIPEPRIW